MKKLFIVVLAAIGMVSCMNTDEVIEVSNGDAIAFADAFIENSVRATAYDNGNLDHFNVWGTVTANGATAPIFDGTNVTKSDNGVWGYTGKTQYWVKNVTYSFRALVYGKVDDVNGKAVVADDMLTGVNVNITDQQDVLVAEDNNMAVTYGGGEQYVAFNFQHILSKVKFTFDTTIANADYTYTISKVQIKDKEKAAYTIGTGWSGHTGEATIKFDSLTDEMFLIPSAEKKTISFDVTLKLGDVVLSNETKTVTTDVELEAGHAYNFTVVLGEPGEPIKFTATVQDWEPAGGFEDIDPSVAVVSNDAELKAAMENSFIKSVILEDGTYTYVKIANKPIKGQANGAIIDMQNKKVGVHGDVNIENVKLVFANANYCGFQHTGVEVYKNCTIVGQPFLYGTDVTFEGCTFEQTSADAYNVWTYGAKNVKFNNCEFNSAGKSVLVYHESNSFVQNVLFEGCTLNASAPVTGKAAIEVDSSLIKEYTININNTTATGFAAGSVSNNTLYNNKKGTKATIIVDGVEVVKPGYTYVNTAEALAAALTANGDVNVALNANIDLPISSLGQQTGGSGEYKLGGDTTGKINIDLNGKTLNVTTSYWSALGAKNDNATITIKNGEMTSTGNSAGTWNAWDLRFSNCNYVFEDVEFGKAVALDNVGKSTVMNNVTITDTHNTDTYGLWITAEGQTVTLNNCVIDMLAATDGRGIKIDEQYVDAPAKVTLNVNNVTFKTEEKAAILVKSVAGAEINVENINIADVVADNQFAVWVDEATKDHAAKVTVNGANVKVEGTIVNIVEVASVDALKNALVDAGNAGSGNTVINLAAGEYTMTNWTPLTVDGYHGADIVTVNGNGAVLKGMTKSLFNGGFAGGSGIVIKDLTIEGAAIVADNTQGYGAFVNCADSMNEITLINCHLINSSIITPNDGANDSRMGGLVGWTSGYSNVNDGPVKTYVNIKNCSVVGCTIKGAGSIGGICGHAGASDWTYTTIENCTVKNNNLISTDAGSWRVGVAVGTANIGQVVVNNLTESGNTLTQGTKVAPTGVRSYVGRLSLGTTGSFVVDGVAITE